jgi:uncharacterized protein YcfJ
VKLLLKSTLLIVGLASVSGCSSDPVTRHEVACVGGTLSGAVIGGVIGNRFGGGSGQTIATGVGAALGGATAATSMNC